MSIIRDLPLELHDHIKSYLPWRDQLKLCYLSKHRSGSRLVEGKEVNWAFSEALSKRANVAIVEQLLKHPDLDPSFNKNGAIQWASQNAHLDIVQITS